MCVSLIEIISQPTSALLIEKMKKVNKQCLLDTPHTVRVSEQT